MWQVQLHSLRSQAVPVTLLTRTLPGQSQGRTAPKAQGAKPWSTTHSRGGRNTMCWGESSFTHETLTTGVVVLCATSLLPMSCWQLLWFLGCFIPEIAGLSLIRYVRDLHTHTFVNLFLLSCDVALLPVPTSSFAVVALLQQTAWAQTTSCTPHTHMKQRGCSQYYCYNLICNSSLWCFVPSPLFLTFTGVSEPICC